MPAHSNTRHLPNVATKLVRRVREGFPGWSALAFAKKAGICNTLVSKWTIHIEPTDSAAVRAQKLDDVRTMGVEVLPILAAQLLDDWPDRGPDIARALVGEILDVCGVRVAPLVTAESDVDGAASRMVRAFLDLARLHAELTAPTSDGGVRLTPDEARQLAPHLPAVIALVEETLAAMPEDNQVVLPWARRTA